MIFDTYVAMDITFSDIRVIEVSGKKITKWSSTPITEGLVKDGIIQDPEAAGIVIDALFKSQKLNRSHVICTITGLPFLYRTINMPGSDSDITTEAIERAARKEMSLTGEDMYLLWQAMGKQSNNGETDYFVVGVPKLSIQPLLETLKSAKIKPYVVGVKPLALARAAALGDACLASLERNYFDIVLVANGVVRVIHSISPTINPDDQLGIVNEFVDGFNKAVKSFNRDFPQDTLSAETPILLAGELTSNAELSDMVKEATGHPTSILQPSMEVPTEIPPGLYVANTGLILKKIHNEIDKSPYHDIKINLLEGLHKPAAKRKFRIAYAGAGAAVLILAALVFQASSLKAGAESDVASLKRQAAQMTQNLSTLQKANKDIQAAQTAGAANLQKLQTELTALLAENDQVGAKKFDYSVRLAAIVQALPEGSEYVKIDMNPASGNISGTAKDPFYVITYTGNLQKINYFPTVRVTTIAPVQNDPGTVTFGVAIPK